jgi:outer membrane protein TolC
MNRAILTIGTLALSGSIAHGAAAQLTLGDAMRQADHSSYGNRIAAAGSAAQTGQSLAPLKGILPSLRFEAGYVRTTDPIGVFGATLRQRAISQANFDPHRLNYPGAIGNYQGGIVLEQPIFNADAWIGRRSAVRAADASRASEEWTQLSTRADVVRAYYGAVLASERAATLQSAARAAHAHVTQAEAMVRQGLVTKSDALLASVRAGEIDAQLAEAEGAAAIGRSQLAVLLGGDGGEPGATLTLPASLPTGDRIRAVVAQDTMNAAPDSRPDVRAAAQGLDAARADALRARSTYLPRVNAFGRYDWNAADKLYAGDRNWTAGIMATWNPLSGAGDRADMQVTAARAVSAQAQAEASQANARVDVEQTRITLAVALTRLSIAERAVTQSAEAHRIVGRKYDGGLATIVELLDAQSIEMQSALALSQARWSAIAAEADRLRALGRDPAFLEALDTSRSVAVSSDSLPR